MSFLLKEGRTGELLFQNELILGVNMKMKQNIKGQFIKMRRGCHEQ